MRTSVLLTFFLLAVFGNSYSQTLSGHVLHFPNKKLDLFLNVGDTLLPLESVQTDSKGNFSFPLQRVNGVNEYFQKQGIRPPSRLFLRLQLHPLQYTDVLVRSYYPPQGTRASQKKGTSGKATPGDISLQLVYHPSQWDNWARDSATVVTSPENKELYTFWKHYRKIQVADKWLLEMSRLFPHSDGFSKMLIGEYYGRYEAMNRYAEQLKKKPDSPAKRIALAYYRPVLPNFGTPDGLRFDTLRQHFWDYFDPNDSLFAFTDVLIDKLEEWVYFHHHHKDSVAGLYLDREDVLKALESYVGKINKNQQNWDIAVRYVLKKLDKMEDKAMFMHMYDKLLKPAEGDCGEQEGKWQWAHEKATVYRNLLKGANAPDFEMEIAGVDGKLRMYDMPGDYLMIIFWASWCPHCQSELPKMKQQIEQWQKEHTDKLLGVLCISLDTVATDWSQSIKNLGISHWMHYSELSGWKGTINKMYNVRATPTLVVVDRDKKIVGIYPFIEKALYELNMN